MACSTRVLPCDSSSITFPSDNALPEISSEHTQQAIYSAADLLKNLQPVAFPTETVYGLGALALDSLASSRIFSTKGRPPDNPLIVHISSYSMLQSILPPNYTPSPAYRTLMRRFWPGPLSLLFPRDPSKVPDIITAGQQTVAVRMPSHPIARALIAVANSPIAAPSANSSGKPSPTHATHVLQDLGGKLSIILDGGPCNVGLESTVIDGLSSDGSLRILRPGGVTVEQIRGALLDEGLEKLHPVLVHRRDYTDEALEAAPTTPGMKYRHYSPSVPVILLRDHSSCPTGTKMQGLSEYFSLPLGSARKIGVLCMDNSPLSRYLNQIDSARFLLFSLGPSEDVSVAARRLFNGLISLEQQGADSIVIEEVKEKDEGLAVMNRVNKAASQVDWIDYTK
jgi:L-threonylcarbamoyladenylate synthase